MPVTNTKVIFVNYSSGKPNADENFKVVKEEIDLDQIVVNEGEVLVKNLYTSLDPYMRLRMSPPGSDSCFPPFPLNEVTASLVISEVIRSNASGFNKGDIITGLGTLAEYSIMSTFGATVIPNARNSPIPLSYYLSILGMHGTSAYVGLHTICEPIKQGETIFISAASGAVGQVVGQYAKLLGLRVVGSAGSDDKVDFLLNELKFDAAFNYKKVDNMVDELKKHCPNGIDIYFENVGGKTLDAVLELCNPRARIPVCGFISQYNKLDSADPIFNLHQIVIKRIKMEGFLVTDFREYYEISAKLFAQYLIEGKMVYKEHITEGLENLPNAFIGMLEGKNFGKATIKIADL